MIYSAAFKAKARAVLQQHWQTALLIALIVNLPTLLVQGISAFTGNDLMIRLEALLVDASRGTAAVDSFPDALRAILSEPGILAMSALGVLAWLVTPALSLGMDHWTLDRIRGGESPVSTVFSRLNIFFKGVGLRLLIALKILLWMLPGIAVMALSIILLRNAEGASREAILSAANTSVTLIWFGMLLMLVLGIMGYLHYAMADFILADEPGERVLSCARRSKEMMKGRRGQLMSLLLSFILWYILISFVTAFVSGIAGDVVGLMLQMLGSLFLSVYMLTSEGVFFEALRTAPLQTQPEEQEPDGDDA